MQGLFDYSIHADACRQERTCKKKLFTPLRMFSNVPRIKKKTLSQPSLNDTDANCTTLQRLMQARRITLSFSGADENQLLSSVKLNILTQLQNCHRYRQHSLQEIITLHNWYTQSLLFQQCTSLFTEFISFSCFDRHHPVLRQGSKTRVSLIAS